MYYIPGTLKSKPTIIMTTLTSQPKSVLPPCFMGGYTIPLRIARDKLLVGLNYEFKPPAWASHHCDPGTKREGDTLKIHFNNYFSERKDLHPCYAYHPDNEYPGHMWIATHSEADWPKDDGNLQENEHDLKIKEFLLTEGKLDAKDLEWCCLWTKISTLREQALIPDTVPYEKMFWAKLNTVEEVKEYFENARRLAAEYYSTRTPQGPDSMEE